MQQPMLLPCCKQHLDQESIKAMVARLALNKAMLPCPLCRKNLSILSPKNDQSPHQIKSSEAQKNGRKIQGIVLNSNLKKEIDHWVLQDPKNRKKLICRASDFPDPSSAVEEPLNTAPTENLPVHEPLPTGHSELLLSQPAVHDRKIFGEYVRFIPENSTFEAKRIRDFLAVFNVIWIEIPPQERPNLQADSQKRLYELALEWMEKEEARILLSNIQTLNLTRLHLHSLPQGLSKLSSLEYLDVSQNTISKLPVIPSLRWLNLRNNRICNVGPHISKMNQLRVLYLGNNPIESISKETMKIKTLMLLELATFSTKFKGFKLELAEFFGKLVCPKEYLNKVGSKLKSLTEEILQAEYGIKKDRKVRKADILKKMPHFSRVRIEGLQKIMNSSAKKGKEPRSQFASPFLLTAISYIAWLYYHHLDDVAEPLFLKLPTTFRNEVYGFIYRKNASLPSMQHLKDLEYGKKAFLHKRYHIDSALRFEALVSTGSQALERILKNSN